MAEKPKSPGLIRAALVGTLLGGLVGSYATKAHYDNKDAVVRSHLNSHSELRSESYDNFGRQLLLYATLNDLSSEQRLDVKNKFPNVFVPLDKAHREYAIAVLQTKRESIKEELEMIDSLETIVTQLKSNSIKPASLDKLKEIRDERARYQEATKYADALLHPLEKQKK